MLVCSSPKDKFRHQPWAIGLGTFPKPNSRLQSNLLPTATTTTRVTLKHLGFWPQSKLHATGPCRCAPHTGLGPSSPLAAGSLGHGPLGPWNLDPNLDAFSISWHSLTGKGASGGMQQ